MGLYDGALGRDGFASTAHVATELDAPVLLVVDISHASRSIGAVVHGMATFDPAVRIAGVVLNKAGSPRHADEARVAVEDLGIPVLGVLHRDDGISAPSRHLGLVPAAERPDAAAALDRLAARVAEHVDVDAVLRIAQGAPDLDAEPWDAAPALGDAARPVTDGVARWSRSRAAGRSRSATPRPRSCCGPRAAGPSSSTRPPTPRCPTGTAAVYLGGGFPEVHADQLGANAAMRSAVRDAVARGRARRWPSAPGLLYLCETVDGAPMAGALAARGAMTPGLTLGYRTANGARHPAHPRRASGSPATSSTARPCCPATPARRPGRSATSRPASRGRRCTRRTCTRTGPASPSSRPGSRRRPGPAPTRAPRA